MNSSFIACLAAIAVPLSALAPPWQLALPGYRYEFPRDHFSHPEYRTEWWYYTGNLRAANGHRFGFELTFFRQAVPVLGPALNRAREQAAASDDTWRPDQIYLAHLALSDIDGGRFYHAERLNRAGPGLAGASLDQQRYWNGNWQVRWVSLSTGEQNLQAVCDRFTLQLDLRPEKPFVINGRNGVSQKGSAHGEASHYISFTRLRAAGKLTLKNSSLSVQGLAWMDHEFFTEVPDNTLAGWDWFAIQLNDNEELMLYRLRTKSGVPDQYSSGSYVDARGEAHSLDAAQFSLSPGGYWQSPASRAKYPLSWNISVPSLGLELSEQTALKDQELFSPNGVSPTYWEGAVKYEGHIHAQPVQGVGYLEMTGYAEALSLGR